MSAFHFGLVTLIAFTVLRPATGNESSDHDDGTLMEISANRLSLRHETDEIRGHHVQLHMPDILIHADAMNLNLSRGFLTLVAPRITLTRWEILIKGSQLVLSSQNKILFIYEPVLVPNISFIFSIRGKEAECGDRFCIVYDSESTLCPHEPRRFVIRSDRVLFRKSGDIDLERPQLYVDEISIFELPWLRFRPERKAGFTFPRFGYDARGGFITGPSGLIPIGKEVALEGYAAVRTRQGFETMSTLHAPDLTLIINQLYDYPVSEARFRLNSAVYLSNTDLFLDLDVITKDRRIIDDVVKTPLERATTHTASRGRLSHYTNYFIFETYLDFIQSFDSNGYFVKRDTSPSASMAFYIPSAPLSHFFWPSLDIRLNRHGMGLAGRTLDGVGSPVIGHTRLEASPSISTVFNLDFLSVNLQAATRHQLWMVDQTIKHTATHAAACKMDLSIPLFRDYGNFRHLVTPFVKYRVVPWVRGANPLFTMDNFDRLQSGHVLEAGISTSVITQQHSSAIGRVDFFDKIELPGLSIHTISEYLSARGYFGPTFLRLSFDGAWDHQLQSLTFLGISVSSSYEDLSFIEIGGRWFGPGDGPHRNAAFSTSSSPWIISPWAIDADRQIVIFSEARIPLSRIILLSMGGQFALHPRLTLHIAWYGLEFRSSCGCLSASIVASHRLSTPVPDIMTSLTVLDF